MKAAKLVAMIAAVAAIPAIGAMADTSKPDVVIGFRTFMPERSEDWDTGGGMELQARFWHNESIGTALCLGFDSWTAKNEYSENTDNGIVSTTSIYGNATVIPVGVSLLYRNHVSDRVALMFEAGVRYLFVQSNINAEIVTYDPSGTSFIKDRITTDYVFAGVVGVSVESILMEGIGLQLGFGYQFDLTNPRETFDGADIGSTSFNSPMVRVGLTWAF